ncbi:hypothetical protein KL905_002004 [Ogataea polymorpha]|nr:hypothetical protein KL935_000072 [Ogataea polymorpha]KAG7908563.1 hypothetical protein KL907_002053 [Ogataea polymorpha]KAG7922783.1 hypothetical protein KL905_002004 [Ogataea polymorpha]
MEQFQVDQDGKRSLPPLSHIIPGQTQASSQQHSPSTHQSNSGSNSPQPEQDKPESNDAITHVQQHDQKLSQQPQHQMSIPQPSQIPVQYQQIAVQQQFPQQAAIQYPQQLQQQYLMQALQIPPPPQPPQLDSSKLFEKCTCKQEGNRIPRPRNAFILFRQKHHQALLEEGNVIRTNPDVSRELGRRWRNLPPEEKEYWNKQAEEEKKRHAERYPGYKYTPRRNSKKNCPHCSTKQAIRNHNLAMQSYMAQYPNHAYAFALNGNQYFPQPVGAANGSVSQQQAVQAVQQQAASQIPQQQALYYQPNMVAMQPQQFKSDDIYPALASASTGTQSSMSQQPSNKNSSSPNVAQQSATMNDQTQYMTFVNQVNGQQGARYSNGQAQQQQQQQIKAEASQTPNYSQMYMSQMMDTNQIYATMSRQQQQQQQQQQQNMYMNPMFGYDFQQSAQAQAQAQAMQMSLPSINNLSLPPLNMNQKNGG